ncbi:MAG: prepilin-type N-terminal cleavage/methylation domain-containing protein [Verrucomicrobia bacterium]|nr:prepilin-type N-terminal cleavage/methylation domain-containing protein [Verrucomicrobiota bacterium]
MLKNRQTVRMKGNEGGFTLIELLVVFTIIGLIAALSMPALKGFGQGNLVNNVVRQLTDDISLARSRAISDRCTVYVLFVSTNIYWERNQFQARLNGAAMELPAIERQRFIQNSRQLWTNLAQQQYTAYAVYASRTVGDQPSQQKPRYLTEWKSLPDGVMFHPYKLTNNVIMDKDDWIKEMKRQRTAGFTNWIEAPLLQMNCHFPNAKGPEMSLPCIAFNHKGELVFPWLDPNAEKPDLLSLPSWCDYEVLPIVKASGFYETPGTLVEITPLAALDKPPLMRIRIDGKTGKVTALQDELREDF